MSRFVFGLLETLDDGSTRFTPADELGRMANNGQLNLNAETRAGLERLLNGNFKGGFATQKVPVLSRPGVEPLPQAMQRPQQPTANILKKPRSKPVPILGRPGD